MDRLDVQILARLQWQPFSPADRERGILGPVAIARELHVHVSTVKRRLQAMEESGVLRGVRLLPGHPSLGERWGACRFDFRSPRGKDRAVDLLRSAGHFTWFSFVGTEMWSVVGGSSPEDIDRMANAFARRTGASRWSLIDRHYWDASVELSELDERIMRAMLNDAHRPLGDVAGACGVTERTVRRRLGRLAEGGAFSVFADISPSRMRGLVPFVLTFEQDEEDEARARRFFDAFPEAFWRGFPRARQPFVMLAARDTAELDGFLSRAYEVPGVDEARFLLFQETRAMVEEPSGALLEAIGANPGR